MVVRVPSDIKDKQRPADWNMDSETWKMSGVGRDVLCGDSLSLRQTPAPP